ncbi:permease-like cell division protein FtsX [Actinoplanes sp. CA-030573]|uniref:permease-like cell division protein FtsX n=1 Tax=Actinoplanes sp. CA-030573 TaxID=3239898 RepID=UPI003D8D49BB
MSDISVTPEAAPVVPERRPARALWLVALLTAAVSMLLGVGIGAGALLVGGWRYQPDREFNVSVFLKEGATAAEKSAIQAELAKMPAKDGVHLETKAEAYQRFKELWKDDPQAPEITPDVLPESFKLVVVGKEFDCAPVRTVRKLPKVGDVIIAAAVTEKHPGLGVHC